MKTGDIVKNKLDGRRMIVIASSIEIEVGDIHCRYFSEETGMYENDYFEPCEVEEI